MEAAPYPSWFVSSPSPDLWDELNQNTIVHAKDQEGMGRGLFAQKDLQVGDKILAERPLVMVARNKNCCDHCLKQVQGFKEEVAVAPKVLLCPKCQRDKYCSPSCLEEAWDRYHRAICPGAESMDVDDHKRKKRKNKHRLIRFEEQCFSENRVYPLLICRIFGQLLVDVEKGNETKGLWRYLCPFVDPQFFDKAMDKELFSLLEKHFANTPIRSIVTLEVYLKLLTMITRYAYGMWTSDKDTSLPENSSEDGVGVYCRASYFNHSCAPTVERNFVDQDSVLCFTASTPIKAGDQLFTEYIDTSLAIDKRRQQLSKLYHFHCSCTKCSEEEKKKRKNKPKKK